jgi:Cof subfamily protein (haloacid dehalogenase superfamily)
MEHPPQHIKMIAIDIDGTLLTPQGEITPRSRMAIQAAQRAGILVTLATSRRYIGARDIAEALGIELPLIVYDGALIVHHPTQAILHSQPLPVDVTAHIVEIFQRHGIQPVIQPCEKTACIMEEIWTGPETYDQPELTTYLAHAAKRLRRLSYAQICQTPQGPLRVVAFASHAAIQQLVPEIQLLPCAWHMLPQGSYDCPELAIMHPACSKGHGVAILAASLGIDMAAVMALGDNINDMEMLHMVGWGVAMGQAPEHVRAVARAVTAPNSEEGVALAIERYALAQPPAYLKQFRDGAHYAMSELPSFSIAATLKRDQAN